MEKQSVLNEYYGALTDKLAKDWKDQEERYNQLFERRVEELSFGDHIKLLKEIITAHAGGKRIIIDYTLPLEDEICNRIKQYFEDESWFVTIYESGHGISVSNFAIDKNLILPMTEYDAFSYRRYKLGNKTTIIDFAIIDYDLADNLMLFSRCIRIRVFDLQIPASQICTPDNKFREGPPLPYNETFKVRF